MSDITKPMLASKAESIEALTFPVIASPKLDGVRCLIRPNEKGGASALSRNFKPIPNVYTRKWLEANVPVGFDGELVVRANGKNVEFNEVSSGIMSEDGEPDFQYSVFDYVKTDISTPFTQRIADLQAAVAKIPKGHIWVVPQIQIDNPADLKKYLDKCLDEGYEGIMVRSPSSPYKCGRSSQVEGYLLKIKVFDDSEAVIEGAFPLLHNANEATLDAFGLTERSQKKAGLVETDYLGGFTVRDLKTGIQFDLGTGYTKEQRKDFWANREKFVEKIAVYKFQGLGVNGRPRFPVWKGFRHPGDMDA